MTITRQDAVLPFRIVAVITAIPGDLATILLNAFTFAILGSDDVNTGSSVVMLGRSMIFKCLRVFGAILICLRLKRMLDAHGVTVTLQVRVVVVLLKKRRPFFLILTIIVAFPTFSPVSLQLVSESPESTDTTSLSLLLKDTVSLVIPSTVNSVSSDKSRSVEIISKEYLDTASVFLRFFLDAADTDAVFARSENTKSSMIHRNKLCLCFMVIIPFCKSVCVIIQRICYILLLYDTIINGIRGKNMSQKERNAIIFPYFYDKLCIITKTSTRKKDV